jgi:hypothetical protein
MTYAQRSELRRGGATALPLCQSGQEHEPECRGGLVLIQTASVASTGAWRSLGRRSDSAGPPCSARPDGSTCKQFRESR